MDFFYPNFINDMWRIFGIIFFRDKEHFADAGAKTFRKEAIEALLNEKGIGLYDTACEVRRTNNTASDKDLEIVKPTDLDALLRRIPHCKAVAATGQKAAEVFAHHFDMAVPKVGTFESFMFNGKKMQLFRMPSSSRAYPMKVEKKAESYRRMFSIVGLLASE